MPLRRGARRPPPPARSVELRRLSPARSPGSCWSALGSALTGTHAFIDAWMAYAGGQPLPERTPAGHHRARPACWPPGIGPDRAMPLVGGVARRAALGAGRGGLPAPRRGAGPARRPGAPGPRRSTRCTAAAPRVPAAHPARCGIVDEHLLVLHRPTRRGRDGVRVSGVADNFQLQTLLADALIGSRDLVRGKRPDARWVQRVPARPGRHRAGACGRPASTSPTRPARPCATRPARPTSRWSAALGASWCWTTPRYSRHWRPGRRFPITAAGARSTAS